MNTCCFWNIQNYPFEVINDRCDKDMQIHVAPVLFWGHFVVILLPVYHKIANLCRTGSVAGLLHLAVFSFGLVRYTKVIRSNSLSYFKFWQN